MARVTRASNLSEEVLERLDLILRLLAFQVASDKSITERARLLKLVGLDNRTIAEVLDTSAATIRSLTANPRTPKTRRSA